MHLLIEKIAEEGNQLVLVTALTQLQHIFFLPGKRKVESRTYSSVELQACDFAKSILFIHADEGIEFILKEAC